jgi:hypothetical protein
MIAAIIEVIGGLLAALVEWIVSLFVAGSEALGAGELLVLVLLFGAELILWAMLVVVELTIAVFRWRRPRRVPKPVIWRPAKLREARRPD